MSELDHEEANSIEYANYFAGHESMEQHYADLDSLVNGVWAHLASCDIKQEVRPGAILALRDIRERYPELNNVFRHGEEDW